MMTSNASQQADLVSLTTGEIDVATFASRHGITEAEASKWRELFVAGMRASATGHARVRKPRGRLMMVGVALLATAAFAQLVTFAADEPAMAVDVNGNFTQLKTWLEAKVGAVSDPGNITTPGKVIAKALAPAPTNYNTVAGTDGTIINDTVGYRSLMILGNTAAGGARAISLWDNVTVNGTMNVFGEFTANNNTWGAMGNASSTDFTVAHTATPDFSWLTCPNGRYVCAVGAGHYGGDTQYWTGARIAVRCCTL